MKTKIRLVLILTFLVYISVYFGSAISSKILFVSTSSLSFIFDSASYIKDAFSKHFDQAKKIEKLREENEELKAYKSQYFAYENELNILKNSSSLKLSNVKLQRARSIAYKELNNFSRVFLDSKNLDESKIYGLVKDGKSAGIAYYEGGNLLALLQSDSLCSFSVYVGSEKTPGVAFGGDELMQVRFVPAWVDIKVGDLVYTSGLDGIFYEGLEVGKVINVSSNEAYQELYVQASSKVALPDYLYIIKSF